MRLVVAFRCTFLLVVTRLPADRIRGGGDGVVATCSSCSYNPVLIAPRVIGRGARFSGEILTIGRGEDPWQPQPFRTEPPRAEVFWSSLRDPMRFSLLPI